MAQAIYFPFYLPSSFAELETFLTTNPHAQQRMRQASEALGYDLLDAFRAASAFDPSELPSREWMVHGSTYMVVYLALADRIDAAGTDVSVCGGQCMGSWVAAVYAGAISPEDYLELAGINGELETEYFASLPEPVGSQVLWMPSPGRTEALLATFDGDLELSLAFGGGMYTVVGPARLLDPLAERAREFGGRPLYRSTRVEHCSLLRPVQEKLAGQMHSYTWRTPRHTFVSEVDGSLLTSGEAVRDDLLDGISRPITWERTVAGLRAAEVDTVSMIGANNKNMLSRVLAKDFHVVSVTPEQVPGQAQR